jgi:hypothetical protein
LLRILSEYHRCPAHRQYAQYFSESSADGIIRCDAFEQDDRKMWKMLTSMLSPFMARRKHEES